jgi:23S rRNA (guanine745-N1)-methyltransferase
MLADVLGCLACPVCGAGFVLEHGSLRCVKGHAFDVARQGYVNLLPGDAKPGTADTTAMVTARSEFLAAGWFAPLSSALAATAADVVDAAGACIVDAGAGTGHYLARVLDALPRAHGVALDLSKAAARRAAHAHPRIAAAVADTWQALPVRDGAADLVLDVFAPRNAAEFRRVLRPRGALVVVTPGETHLEPLVAALGLVTVEEEKRERLERGLGGMFERVRQDDLGWEMELPAEAVRQVVSMGPSARHLVEGELEDRVAALSPPVRVTGSVVIGVYRAC